MDTNKLRLLILGQATSLLLTGTGVFTELIEETHAIHMPVLQNLGNYLLLCCYLTYSINIYYQTSEYPIKIAWWKYALVAFADVEGNVLAVTAFKYTSIAHVLLLNSFTIPVVMVLSIIVLQAKYSRGHYIAVGSCIIGIILLVVSDRHKIATDSTQGDILYGDMLCLLGSIIYGCSNVGQEYIIKKKHERTEFLGMMGFFGTITSIFHFLLFEEQQWEITQWTTNTLLYLACYVLTLFLLYITTSIFMEIGDAAIFNLSLLTSDVFGVIAAKCLFHETFSYIYFIGFIFIVIGIIIYNRCPSPTTSGTIHPSSPETMLLIDYANEKHSKV